MVDPEKLLADLGFGESEARAYVTLLASLAPLNGYELAKVSGIPRGNIYKVLEKLEARGAVARVEGEGGTRYAPVSPGEVLPRLAEGVQRRAEEARAVLEDVRRPPQPDLIWNVQGYEPLVDQARSLIASARTTLTMALCRSEASVLAREMIDANARGIDITTLCLTGCPQECGGCQGRIYRHSVAPAGDNRWLIVVPDESEVLAGEISVGVETVATGLRTRQRMIVKLASGYTQRSAALAEVAERLDAGGPPTDLRNILRLIRTRS
jgi:HTH-type transcriptional regulator, sugar sensing transcriptional regulator